MASTVSARVYTGLNAGTESAAVDGIDLINADNATNSAFNRSLNEVDPGSNSYEKWMRLKVDDSDGLSLSSFWIERDGDLPDGVTIKMGATATPATPVVTTSTVATTTMADGRRYYFDMSSYSIDGAYTRYLVLQEQVSGASNSGSIATQTFQWGWSE